MMQKFSIEAVDRTLRDIRKCDQLFGGITTVIAGDFRQISPVVPRGTRAEVVSSFLKQSTIWRNVEILRLQRNIRVEISYTKFENTMFGSLNFAQWLLAFGNSQISMANGDMTNCPTEMMLPAGDIEAIVHAIYPRINGRGIRCNEYLAQRAILAPRNDNVGKINDLVLSMLPGESKVYLSADSTESSEATNVYPT